MVNRMQESKRGALDAAQEWTNKRVLQPIGNAMKIVSGQAAHDEIKAYILDNEAVHTALVTRLLRAESRIRLLTVVTAILAIVEILHWFVR